MVNNKGEITESGLFFDAYRIIKGTKPKYAIAENVKNLVGNKFKPQFDMILSLLDEAGYNNYWSLLNSKRFGVPQNRERVYLVSIRKDIDDGSFKFPDGDENILCIRDILLQNVDDKYYMPDDRVKIITDNYIKQILKQDKVIQIGNFMQTGHRKNPNQGRVYDPDGLAPTLTKMEGGQRQPFVVLEEHGRYKVRKLTPNETFRLQGFSDEEFRLAEDVCSDSQLYKQIGNSITVNVISSIYLNFVAIHFR